MKTLILSLVFFSTLIGCNKNEDVQVPQQVNPIVASWQLTKFEAGFGPTINYTNNEIKWTFNQNNTVDVIIVSGINVPSNLPLKTTGNFNYTIPTTGVILNNDQLNYEITGNVMIISDFVGQAADGRKLTFIRL